MALTVYEVPDMYRRVGWTDVEVAAGNVVAEAQTIGPGSVLGPQRGRIPQLLVDRNDFIEAPQVTWAELVGREPASLC